MSRFMSIQVYEISVLISTYDDRDMVEKKLLEIQGQTAFERAEFIFIEPASPGRERELLGPFCDLHVNCRLIKLEERVGLYRAWNLGWEAATAPLVCISNMDDAMHPELLERVLLDAQRKDWDVATVLTAKQSIDEDWNSWDLDRMSRLTINTRSGAFFAWKRELQESLGMFDARLQMIGDKDFWARVAAAGLQISLVPFVLYLYSKHPDQLSKKEEFRSRKSEEQVLCAEKDYPHLWPVGLQRRIRYYRWAKWFLLHRRLYVRTVAPRD
jgi:GT2 family glycosyltransferase